MRELSIVQRQIHAQDGMNGGSSLSHGQRGRDAVVLVPCGTLVDVLDPSAGRSADDDAAWLAMFCAEGEAGVQHGAHADDDAAAGDDRDDDLGETPLRNRSPTRVDLVRDGDQIIVAKGGRGGMGNRTSNMRYRRGVQYAPVAGAAGDRVRVRIELKLLADIGLVGYPNAGKSTLLSILSRARPRIDSYPFTTLHPNLGVIEFDDIAQTRCTIADIPGLIAGAADNRGLGHEFLRHIERTQVLLYVVDVAGTEGRDPIQDYRQLRLELGRYEAGLVQRPALIFANKTDRRPATCARNLERLRAEASRDGLAVIAGSALARRQISDLRGALYDLVRKQIPDRPLSSSWR